MDALEALRTRRSVRAYEDRPVPREALEAMVDCARLAASAMNQQPWAFVVVTERSRLKTIAEATDYGRHIGDAGACVAVFCREGKYFLEDGAAATQNLLIAAHVQGLGACWVAGDKKTYVGQISEMLEMPVEYRLISLVAVGYPADTPQPEKRPLQEVLHWQKWGGKEAT